MSKKAIDKDYLLRQFSNFDTDVLEDKYDAKDIWTSATSCAIGDTGVTISNAAITSTSNIKIWSETSSGKPLNYSTIVITTGQAVITFASALTEATSIKLQIVK